MLRFFARMLVVLVPLLATPCPALPCSLCSNIRQSPTLRHDAGQAHAIVYGPVANPRLINGTAGITDLRVEATVKSHQAVAGKQVIELARYLPVSDPGNPPRFLVFCNINDGKLDPYRGVPVPAVAVDYLKGALALDPSDRTKALRFFFNYLEHADKEIARDAFLEFARASEQDLGQLAGKLPADKLRGWLKDQQTPVERLGLYAFLLGICGGDADAALFKSLLDDKGERTLTAFDGILSGYIQLRPKEGWEQALALLRDGQKSFAVRFATLRTLRLYHLWKPEETRQQVLQGMAAILSQGELADMAAEDLRRWQIWDLTPQVLARYGQKDNGPIARAAIVRYALCCPLPAAASFVAEVRKQDAELVKDVEESIQFEKQEPASGRK